MKALPLATIAELCGGTLRAGDGARTVTSVNTDSRKITPGEVFVALVGEKFDAHDFIPQVAQSGAAAVIVSRVEEAWRTLPCAIIEAGDTLLALQKLAQGYRRLHNPLVIGITGSNGKTSTKDFARAVLSRKFKVCATIGNLNNHIGLPLSILRLGEHDDCCILEMGMNHHGEIKVLADIAQPDAGIITNIGVAHIEHMGSREGIAKEKGTLASAVPADGWVVLNANDDFTATITSDTKAQVVTAGVGCGDVSALDLKREADGTSFTLDFSGEKVTTYMPIPGEHMVGNAALAAAAGWKYGIAPAEIAAALREVKLTGGRLETKHIGGVTFLDDSYNANPDSMRAGLRTLTSLGGAGRRVAVLGRMGELGEHAVPEHRALGQFAAGLNLAAVFTVGDEAALITDAAHATNTSLATQNFTSHNECAAHLRSFLKDGDIVLLKGSRSAGMEKVLSHYQAP